MWGSSSLLSVFFCQHDRQHPVDERLSVCVLDIWLFIQIDLEKDRLAIDLKRPKVVFLVWVIGVAETVVDGDRFDDASDSISAEGGNTGGNEGRADCEVLAQLVALSARMPSDLVVIVVSL